MQKSFPTQKEMHEMYEKHVRHVKGKSVKKFRRIALEWMKLSEKERLTYDLTWFGIPVVQYPEDLVLMQELIYKLRPDVIVETGIAHGGSLIFYASICELLGKGEVIGIDIEIRRHNRRLLEKHPFIRRVKLIEGSSTLPATFGKCKKMLKSKKNVLVILDSNHTRPHVLEELRMYSQFVPRGGYIVAFDTNMDDLLRAGYDAPEWRNNNVKTAVKDFLRENKSFKIDPAYHKYFISSAPDGFLKRVR